MSRLDSEVKGAPEGGQEVVDCGFIRTRHEGASWYFRMAEGPTPVEC